MFGAPSIVPQVGSDLLPLPRFHLTMTSGSVSLPAIDHPCDNSKGRLEVLTLYPKRLTIYQTQSVLGLRPVRVRLPLPAPCFPLLSLLLRSSRHVDRLVGCG